MIKHLTEAERQAIAAKLPAAKPGELRGWPDWAPKQYNACTDPCDMFDGPCACGAWHHEGR